jgi:DNA-binding CsgD family transcriptional regulator
MKQIFFLLLFPVQLFCQNTIGFPDIINYAKHNYKAGLQNWDIKQDKWGKMYFANNEGLLCFDGKYWSNYPLPNKTNVRSVEIDKNNFIYVGGQDEIGYFAPNENGQLIYHSIKELIPEKDRLFGDIWDIVSFKGNIYFRSTTKIFKYTKQTIAVFSTSNSWEFLGSCNEKLYLHDSKTGLMVYDNDIWHPVFTNNVLPTNDPVTSILPITNDSAIITTLRNGLYTLSSLQISSLPSSNNALFKNDRVYAATLLSKERIALATTNNGVYIIDTKGNIIQQFTTTEGLQNNNILSIAIDNQQNLWLGLDNGIDLITNNSAIKQIKPQLQNNSGYTAIVHDNKLFLGTSNGLYSVPILKTEDLSFTKGYFTAVDNLKGQVWNLATINNQLLVGHHEGAFVVQQNAGKSISSSKGFWNFLPLSNTFPTPKLIAGGYFGLTLFDYTNNNFIPSHSIAGFNESSRYVVVDKDGSIWVSQPYHGVFKIVQNANNTYSNFIYGNTKGLPSFNNNHVFYIKSELVIGTEKGVYIYNKQKDFFEPSPYYQKLLGNQSIRYLKEDTEGNIWFIHEKKIGVIDFSTSTPTIIQVPELYNKMLSGFEFIYPVNSSNIFLGGEKGFYHINYDKYKTNNPKLHVFIRKFTIGNTIDSVVFNGNYNNENQQQSDSYEPSVHYKWKTIRFQFASPTFGNQDNLEFSFRLKGYDNNWSEWSDRTEKEYTNLPPGNFNFEVRVRNNLGAESEPTTFAFTILPPWYSTIWAKLLYMILLITGLYYLYKFYQKKLLLQQQKHDEEQQKLKYIHELELSKSESELVSLQNEKLEAEISFKNSELASNAMHLVKKGELVNKIKTELSQIVKQANSAKLEADIKKMMKSISEDDAIDEEWEKFANHFDKVHGDFITALKQMHPIISNNEVKLCAYLRMNLSTKEIAQLMNISIRGVEISRYRLRKKLNLPTETNLFDYLINLKKDENQLFE